MRRLAFVLALLLPWPAEAAAPKAVVKAPSTASAGSVVQLDFTGTVSDLPVRVLISPEGKLEVGPNEQVRGWRLNAPGSHTFYVTAYGTPDGSNVLVPDVAKCEVEVMSAGPPAKPPVVPSGDPLSSAAQTYLRGIPAGLRKTAAEVRSGSVGTIPEMNVSITNLRKSTGQSLAGEWDRRFKSMVDGGTGRITDTEGVATALEAAAAAQEAILQP